MIVIISWHADGSGKPEVAFRDLTLNGGDSGVSMSGLGLLAEDIRATQNKECKIYNVNEKNVITLYDSTEDQ